MSMKLEKSQVSNQRVSHLVDMRIKAFKDFSGGKPPTSQQRESMKKEVVSLAKRVNQDRGIL